MISDIPEIAIFCGLIENTPKSIFGNERTFINETDILCNVHRYIAFNFTLNPNQNKLNLNKND